MYRAAWRNGQPRVGRQFWINANGNALDIAVLEWCKLFADKDGKHHWRRLIDDQQSFRSDLCDALHMSPYEFKAYVKSVLHYRNKFVAHLDEEAVMHVPATKVLRKSAAFLFERLRNDATNEQHLADAPSAQAHYTWMFRHARSELARAT